jgi:integrase
MTLTKILRTTGLAERATVHGFRSSFRDWADENTSASHSAMELSLAHRVGPAVEQAYARSDLLEQRRVLMDTWAEYLCGGLTYGKSYYGVFTFKGEHSKSELDAR